MVNPFKGWIVGDQVCVPNIYATFSCPEEGCPEVPFTLTEQWGTSQPGIAGVRLICPSDTTCTGPWGEMISSGDLPVEFSRSVEGDPGTLAVRFRLTGFNSTGAEVEILEVEAGQVSLVSMCPILG